MPTGVVTNDMENGPFRGAGGRLPGSSSDGADSEFEALESERADSSAASSTSKKTPHIRVSRPGSRYIKSLSRGSTASAGDYWKSREFERFRSAELRKRTKRTPPIPE